MSEFIRVRLVFIILVFLEHRVKRCYKNSIQFTRTVPFTKRRRKKKMHSLCDIMRGKWNTRSVLYLNKLLVFLYILNSYCLSLLKVSEMREKNLDLMRQDIVSVLKNSSMAFVRELVGADPVAVFRWAILRAFFRAYFAFHEAGIKHRQLRGTLMAFSVEFFQTLSFFTNFQ